MQMKETGTDIYRFIPTKTGFKNYSTRADDIERGYVCALYPDCDRSAVYNEEQLKIMERQPYRPVICAMITPAYSLDLHGVSGMAGSGRFVAVKDAKAYWLDQFDEIDTSYENGEIYYKVRTADLPGVEISISFLPTVGAGGMVGCVDCRELDDSVKVYYLHGGMLGWNTHVRYIIPYTADQCWENVAAVDGHHARICLGGDEYEHEYTGLKEVTYKSVSKVTDSAWDFLAGWRQEITVRADGEKLYITDPTAMVEFDEKLLSSYHSAKGGLICAKLTSGRQNYIAAARGKRVEKESLQELYDASHKRCIGIGERLAVHTKDTALDGAVRMGAYASEGIYGDNVFLHGAVSWRDGFLGWRSAYGPINYGMLDQAYSHFDNHFRISPITEGEDKGTFIHRIEDAGPDAKIFYNMMETFTDQVRYYLDYTGDKDVAKRFLPLLEKHIDWEIRKLKPGKEWLFEGCLNAWITDTHWAIEGQCSQASAYMYNMFRMAADLTDDPKKKEKYTELAALVKEDMQRVLWQKRKGVCAFSKDLRGNKLLHGEPELGDIYFPAEFGITDQLQTYQALDWGEANLRQHMTANGGKVIWAQDWHPNAGDTFSHTTYELAPAEYLNLALIYFKMGLANQGYEIFKSMYMTLYSGDDGTMEDIEVAKLKDDGHPPRFRNGAGDFSCQVYTTGTPRRNPQFADTISMFGRALYEGLLGVNPRLMHGKIELTPCIPDEISSLKVTSAVLDYIYERGADFVSIAYKLKKEAALCVSVYLPVVQVCTVEADGIEVPYEMEPIFGGVKVTPLLENIENGKIFIKFAPLAVTPIENRIMIKAGERLHFEYPGEEITELLDPQGLLENPQFAGDHVCAKAADSEGSGVFFLKMRVGDVVYFRPVKVWIKSAIEMEKKIFISPAKEFAGPLQWIPIDMDDQYNAGNPNETITLLKETSYRPPREYSQVGAGYYRMHLDHYLYRDPRVILSDTRWRSLVDEDGIAMTGEKIPFRSRKDGDYMAAATLSSDAFPDSVTVPVNASGRAAYLLITGITFPMQSHVENIRVIFTYEDGVVEEHPLVSPFDIGDCWSCMYGRWHDTAANGFENLSGHAGPASSAGLDLNSPINVATEAHILRFHLREGVKVKSVEMRMIALEILFALMGITLLQ